MKVAVVSTSAERTTGWGTMCAGLVTALTNMDGFSATALVPRGSEITLDFEVRPVLPPWTRQLGWHPRRLASWTLGAARHLKDFDGVVCVAEYPFAIGAASTRRWHLVPYVIVGQGTYLSQPFERQPDRLLFTWALRNASLVTVPSEFSEAELARSMPLEQVRRLRRRANPLDLGRFAGSVSLLPDIRSDVPVVLSVGANKPRKGFDVLLQAMRIVRDSRPDAILAVAGPGTDTLSGAGVIGLGSVGEAELAGLYERADVFALLPRQVGRDFEAFGLVYVEAGLARCPVVAADSGGVASAVQNGWNGLVVRQEDAGAAALAILTLLDDPALASLMGERGHQMALANSYAEWASWLVREAGWKTDTSMVTLPSS